MWGLEGGSKVQGPWLQLLECPYPPSTDPARGGNESWELAAGSFSAASLPGVLVGEDHDKGQRRYLLLKGNFPTTLRTGRVAPSGF